jgi:hypothetical protein
MQPTLAKPLHDCICAAGFPKQAKHQIHGAPHFFIGIGENATFLAIAITDGQRVRKSLEEEELLVR